MAMKRTGTPWMKADDFGRSLPRGIGLNLLVSEIASMETFCRDVLGAKTVYCDEDFGVIEILGSVFLLHADHSYSDNPMNGVIAGAETRGAGIEIRIYGADPDGIEARARDKGHIVLAGSVDKPHGLRECHIVGPEGYVFLPSQAIGWRLGEAWQPRHRLGHFCNISYCKSYFNHMRLKFGHHLHLCGGTRNDRAAREQRPAEV